MTADVFKTMLSPFMSQKTSNHGTALITKISVNVK